MKGNEDSNIDGELHFNLSRGNYFNAKYNGNKVVQQVNHSNNSSTLNFLQALEGEELNNPSKDSFNQLLRKLEKYENERVDLIFHLEKMRKNCDNEKINTQLAIKREEELRDRILDLESKLNITNTRSDFNKEETNKYTLIIKEKNERIKILGESEHNIKVELEKLKRERNGENKDKEINDLNFRISQLEGVINENASKFRENANALVMVEKQNKCYLSEKNSLLLENNRLEAKLKEKIELIKQLEEYSKQLNRIISDTESSVKEAVDIKKELKKKTLEANEINEILKETKRNRDLLKIELENKNKVIDQYQKNYSAITSSNNLNTNLYHQIQSLQQEVSKLKEMYSLSQNENLTIKRRFDELIEENSRKRETCLKEDVFKREISLLKENLAVKDKDLEKTKNRLKELETEVNSLNTSLKLSIKENEEKDKVIINLSQENTKTRFANKQKLDSEALDLNLNYKEKYLQNCEILTDYKEKYESFAEQVLNTRKLFEVKCKEVEDLQLDNMKLVVRIKELEVKISSGVKESFLQAKENKLLNEDFQNAGKDLAIAENKVLKAKAQLKNEVIIINHLKEAVAEKDKCINERNAEIHSLRFQLQKLGNDNKNLNSESETMKAKLLESDEKNKRLISMLKHK